MPFFSIIIPTYNRAHLIRQAISSVVNQSFTDWELLIVDDGSTDNTKEVVCQFFDDRIHYIYQENAERCAARNNGVALAKGAYICFLDSDDYFLPNRLSELHKTISKIDYPKFVFFTGLKTLSSKGENDVPIVFENGTQKYDYIANTTIHCQQVCAEASILKAYLFNTKFRIGEDLELWLRINATIPFFYLEEQFTVVVVDHDERSVNIKKYNAAIEELATLNYCFSKHHPGKGVSNEIKENKIGRCLFNIAKYHIYNRNRIDAAYFVFLSVVKDTHSKQLLFRVNVLSKLICFSSFNKTENLLQ